MDDLNELSNEELQYRLTQFGSPNLPVTSTTRKVLLKKLRNLIENEKSKLRRDTDYATRYSSDEDVSGLVTKSGAKSIKGRGRSTISANARLASNRTNLNMPPPPSSSSSTSSTQQKLLAPSWADKSQVFSIRKQFFFFFWIFQKLLRFLDNIFEYQNKKIGHQFDLYITINST